jgi:hypothetical protein
MKEHLMPDANKPWYTSLTIISALIAMLITVGKLVKLDLSFLQGMESDIVVLLTTVTAIYGRVRAVASVTR